MSFILDSKLGSAEELLNKFGSKVLDDDGDLYYLPFWFKKQKNGLFSIYHLNDLPKHIQNIIRKEII